MTTTKMVMTTARYLFLLWIAIAMLFLVLLSTTAVDAQLQLQPRRQRRHGKHGHAKKKPIENSFANDACDTKFVKYQSSPYESRWLSEINLRGLFIFYETRSSCS